MLIHGGIENLDALQTKRLDNFYLYVVQPNKHVGSPLDRSNRKQEYD